MVIFCSMMLRFTLWIKLTNDEQCLVTVCVGMEIRSKAESKLLNLPSRYYGGVDCPIALVCTAATEAEVYSNAYLCFLG